MLGDNQPWMYLPQDTGQPPYQPAGYIAPQSMMQHQGPTYPTHIVMQGVPHAQYHEIYTPPGMSNMHHPRPIMNYTTVPENAFRQAQINPAQQLYIQTPCHMQMDNIPGLGAGSNNPWLSNGAYPAMDMKGSQMQVQISPSHLQQQAANQYGNNIIQGIPLYHAYDGNPQQQPNHHMQPYSQDMAPQVLMPAQGQSQLYISNEQTKIHMTNSQGRHSATPKAVLANSCDVFGGNDLGYSRATSVMSPTHSLQSHPTQSHVQQSHPQAVHSSSPLLATNAVPGQQALPGIGSFTQLNSSLCSISSSILPTQSIASTLVSSCSVLLSPASNSSSQNTVVSSEVPALPVQSSPMSSIQTSCNQADAMCVTSVTLLTSPLPTCKVSSDESIKFPPVTAIVVPFGWRRVAEDGKIVYYSPSGSPLQSLDDIKAYVTSEGTCKCGLECPVILPQVFSFDSNRPSKSWDVNDAQVMGSSTRWCTHQRKITAMATLQQSAGWVGEVSRRSAKPVKEKTLSEAKPTKMTTKGRRKQKATQLDQGDKNCTQKADCNLSKNNPQLCQLLSDTYKPLLKPGPIKMFKSCSDDESSIDGERINGDLEVLVDNPKTPTARPASDVDRGVVRQRKRKADKMSDHDAPVYNAVPVVDGRYRSLKSPHNAPPVVPPSGPATEQRPSCQLNSPMYSVNNDFAMAPHGCPPTGYPNYYNSSGTMQTDSQYGYDHHQSPYVASQMLTACSQRAQPFRSPQEQYQIGSSGSNTWDNQGFIMPSTYGTTPGYQRCAAPQQSPIQMVQNMISGLQAGPNAMTVALQPNNALAVSGVRKRRRSAASDCSSGFGSDRPYSNSFESLNSPCSFQSDYHSAVSHGSAAQCQYMYGQKSFRPSQYDGYEKAMTGPSVTSLQMITNPCSTQMLQGNGPPCRLTSSCTDAYDFDLAEREQKQTIESYSPVKPRQKNTSQSKARGRNKSGTAPDEEVNTTIAKILENAKKEMEREQGSKQDEVPHYMETSTGTTCTNQPSDPSPTTVCTLPSNTPNTLLSSTPTTPYSFNSSSHCDISPPSHLQTDLFSTGFAIRTQRFSINHNSKMLSAARILRRARWGIRRRPISLLDRQFSACDIDGQAVMETSRYSHSSDGSEGKHDGSGGSTDDSGINCDQQSETGTFDSSQSPEYLQQRQQHEQVFSEVEVVTPRTFRVGDLVWGPSRGVSSWPGKIVASSPRGRKKVEKGKVLVRWFGDHSVTAVDASKLKTLSEGLEAHHRARKNIRRGRNMNLNLERAIQEAMAELDRQAMSTTNPVTNMEIKALQRFKNR